jgi:hypothetical protein
MHRVLPGCTFGYIPKLRGALDVRFISLFPPPFRTGCREPGPPVLQARSKSFGRYKGRAIRNAVILSVVSQPDTRAAAAAFDAYDPSGPN